jgi:RNA methyltransferase, TrmH family
MITSKTNSRIREIRLLRQAKYRRERGEYFVEGIKLLAEVLRQSLRVRKIAHSPQLEKSPRGQELLSRAREILSGAEWMYVSDEVMDSMSDAQTHQGVLAVLEKRAASWADLLAREGILLLLHELQDPGNVGAILRAADAGEAAGVILSPGTADPYGPKAVRAGMGSLFRVPLLVDQEVEESIRLLQSRDIWVGAATLRGERSLWEADLCGRCAVLFGNEGGGLPEAPISLCDGTITVPMNPQVDSLNVAITAGLVVYEALRQRGNRALQSERRK